MELAPHFWTIAPCFRHALPRRSSWSAAVEPWRLAVADPRVGTVYLSGLWRDVPGSTEAVVVVHGMGGAADSHYMQHPAAAAEAAGLSCLRLNLRGTDGQGTDFYHAGLTADLDAALAAPELARFRRFYLIGYSLGGHLVLSYALAPRDPRVQSVASLCAPLDLALSSASFDTPGRWLYRRYVLGNVQTIYAALVARAGAAGRFPLPVAEARRIRLLREWDERIVAPHHGFAGAADYYTRESVGPRLDRLKLPALIVATQGDPMVPAATLRPSLERELPRLTVRWLAEGGHVAFPEGAELGLGPERGVERQVLGWLRRVAQSH